MRAPLLALLALPLLPFLHGCPSCPYDEACEGNVLKFCSVGVDQLVGSPSEGERACAGVNPTCITVDDQNALCAIANERTCNPGVAPRCDGLLLITCEEGFEVAEDCGAHGNVCGTLLAETFCYREPVIACAGSTFITRCEGTRLVECRNGVEAYADCALRGTNGRCESGSSGSGYSYCAWED